MWAKLQPKEGQPGPGAPLPLQAAPSRSGEDVGREFKRSRREQRAEIEAGSMGERSQVEGQGGRGRHRLPREGRKEKESKNKGKEKRKESQEPESGGKSYGQEGGRSLHRNWAGSGSKGKKAHQKKGKEEAQKIKNLLIVLKPKLRVLQQRRRRLGLASGPKQGPVAGGGGARSADRRVFATHEDSRPPGLRVYVGNGLGQPPADSEPIYEESHSSSSFGRNTTRSSDNCPCPGPAFAGTSSGSCGHFESEAKEPRVDHFRSTVGYFAKNRSSSTARSYDGFQSRSPSSAKGGAAGCSSQRPQRELGQGQDQGQGQRQREGERQRRQDQRRGKEKLLTEGGASEAAMEKVLAAPEKRDSDTPEEKMACLSARGCQDDRCQSETAASSDGGVVGMGGTTELPTFHLHDGGTAISPDFTPLLDLSPTVARDAGTAGHLGLGRVAGEKEGELAGDRGKHVGDIYTWLEGRMDFFIDRHCKTKPTGRVYPLPTSFHYLSQVFPQCPPVSLSVLRCLVVSLNSLNGERLWNDSCPTAFQKQVLAGLMKDCRRVSEWVEPVPEVSWADFFSAEASTTEEKRS